MFYKKAAGGEKLVHRVTIHFNMEKGRMSQINIKYNVANERPLNMESLAMDVKHI